MAKLKLGHKLSLVATAQNWPPIQRPPVLTHGQKIISIEGFLSVTESLAWLYSAGEFSGSKFHFPEMVTMVTFLL